MVGKIVGKNTLAKQEDKIVVIHSGLVEIDEKVYGSIYKTLDGKMFVGFAVANESHNIIEMKNGIIDYPHLLSLGAIAVSTNIGQ